MAEKQFNWVNPWRVAQRAKVPFLFFIGGRGIGKTYNTLLEHYNAIMSGDAAKVLYMRLTPLEMDLAASEDENPYKKINKDNNMSVNFQKVKGLKKIDLYNIFSDDGDDPEKIGLGVALPTFKNLRGVDFSDYDYIYFDEFIPTEHVRATPEIKKAGYLFKQAYETINRNREILGYPPVQVIFTANAFSLDSSILKQFGLINVIVSMQQKGQHRYTNTERGIYVELCEAPDIAAAKRDTALYRALKDDDELIKLNIENAFEDKSFRLVNNRARIIEYQPLVKFNNLVIYRHKSTGALYCASRACDSAPEEYSNVNKKKFLLRWGSRLRMIVYDEKITFDRSDTYYQLCDVLEKR